MHFSADDERTLWGAQNGGSGVRRVSSHDRDGQEGLARAKLGIATSLLDACRGAASRTRKHLIVECPQSTIITDASPALSATLRSADVFYKNF